MKLEELLNNEELLAVCAKEVEEKVRGGQDTEQAKIEVLKAHGVELDEDAIKAQQVEKMPLSDEELEGVSGGANWCWKDHACVTAYRHDDEAVHGDACAWDYECLFVLKCDLDGARMPC